MKFMDQNILEKRRAKFLSQMGKGVAVLFAAPHAIRNADSHYKYRTDSSFYYLTGFSEPGAMAIFAPATDAPYRLFVPPKDPFSELWDGKRLGVEGARAELRPDLCYSIAEFDTVFRELLKHAGRIYYPIGEYPSIDDKISHYIRNFHPKLREGEKNIYALLSTVPLLAEARKVKDAMEIAHMRKNCKNSALAHQQAMAYTRPGRYEYQVEAKINQCFQDGGAESIAYTSIVAGGANATILHYVTNRDQLRDGSLLLIDAGGEMDHYASDITRTFPVNGKFSPVQKRVYEIVLRAQKAAIEKARVGMLYSAMHATALEILVDGLLELKVLDGSREQIIKEKKYTKYYPHGTGHWLGMDVHDAGTYFTDEFESIPLTEGNVLTVEPGLYFPEDDTSIATELRGIGIRIEDDIVVTKGDPEVLTCDVPKEVDAIEAIVGSQAG